MIHATRLPVANSLMFSLNWSQKSKPSLITYPPKPNGGPHEELMPHTSLPPCTSTTLPRWTNFRARPAQPDRSRLKVSMATSDPQSGRPGKGSSWERGLAVRFPSGPSTRPETLPPLPLVNRHPLRIGPERSRARSGGGGPLTARTDPGSFGEREKRTFRRCSDLSGLRAFPQG